MLDWAIVGPSDRPVLSFALSEFALNVKHNLRG